MPRGSPGLGGRAAAGRKFAAGPGGREEPERIAVRGGAVFGETRSAVGSCCCRQFAGLVPLLRPRVLFVAER